MPRGTSRIFREKVRAAAKVLGIDGTDFRNSSRIFNEKARAGYQDLGFSVSSEARSGRLFRSELELANSELGIFPVPPFSQTFSLDFEGSSESMGQSGTSSIGFADTFSIAAWANFGNTTSRQDTLWTVENGAGDNIALFQRTNVGAAPSYQAFGGNINLAFTSLPISSGVWHHVVFVWDTNAFVHLYIDGVDQLTSQGSVGGTYADTNRTVQVGDGSSGVPNGLMKCAMMAIWPVRLADAEIVTIFNAGSINIDLRVDQGNYVNGLNVEHWWPLGKDPSPLLGQDLGFGTPIDLELGAVGMTDADRVADVP